jgi:AP-1 complex subunit gamma-1
MPAPEIREENRVLGEATPKKGKRKSTPIKQSAQQDLLDILGGAEDDKESPKAEFGESAKNAELLKDLFGSGPSTNGGVGAPSPAKSNVSDIMDLFGSSGGMGVTAPPPAISTGGSTSALDDIFGRTAEPAVPQMQSYGINPIHLLLIPSSRSSLFKE